ncbi:hypothetical protein ALC57_00205, partial [Trachymyrmex cornetzi]
VDFLNFLTLTYYMDESSIDKVILSVFSFRKQQLFGCVKLNLLKDVVWKQEQIFEDFVSTDCRTSRLGVISADCCRMFSANRKYVRVNSLVSSRYSSLELSFRMDGSVNDSKQDKTIA